MEHLVSYKTRCLHLDIRGGKMSIKAFGCICMSDVLLEIVLLLDLESQTVPPLLLIFHINFREFARQSVIISYLLFIKPK